MELSIPVRAASARSCRAGHPGESKRSRYARTTQDIGFQVSNGRKASGISRSVIMMGVAQNHRVMATARTWPVSRR